MRLKYEFVMTQVEDEYMAVPVGKNADDLKAVIRLNDSGHTIMNLLKNDITREELLQKLQETYEDENLVQYMDDFLKKLRLSGLLEE